jgi:hypothetical protein
MNSYKLTSDKIVGNIELQYDNGRLNLIKITVKLDLNAVQFRSLMATIPQYEADIENLQDLNLTVSKDAPSNEKIGMFCRSYEQHVGIKYKVTRMDSGKIKHVKLNDEILTVYFTCTNSLFKGKYSISNLVNFYNELLVEVKNAGKPKSQHPDTWNQAYYNTLSPPKATAYFAHLRSLGFVAKKDTSHNIIEFYKPPIN